MGSAMLENCVKLKPTPTSTVGGPKYGLYKGELYIA